jgi:hypothetical protein
MRGTRLASMSAVAAAGVLFAAACASAATVAPAAGRPASGGKAVSGPVHFSGFSQNNDGPDFSVVLSGVVGDYGPAVTVFPNGKADPEHRHQLSLRLKKGSFRLRFAPLDKAIVAVTSRWAKNPTCSFHANVTAPTPVVTGSGTGLYKGIKGGLTMTVTIDEVDIKPCPGGTSKFLSQNIFLIGSGTVSLP